jgi:adenosylmethionine-8-amino-7-oxononanoate aminotransferase
MAITTFTQDIFDAFMKILIKPCFMVIQQSTTGCAAALASLELLNTPEMQANLFW